jgi:hypothetical protein
MPSGFDSILLLRVADSDIGARLNRVPGAGLIDRTIDCLTSIDAESTYVRRPPRLPELIVFALANACGSNRTAYPLRACAHRATSQVRARFLRAPICGFAAASAAACPRAATAGFALRRVLLSTARGASAAGTALLTCVTFGACNSSHTTQYRDAHARNTTSNTRREFSHPAPPVDESSREDVALTAEEGLAVSGTAVGAGCRRELR